MSPRPFAVNPVMTAIAIGYSNPAISLIADRVLPKKPAAAKFAWTRYGQSDFFRVPNTRVGRKGRVAQVEFSAEPVADEVADYGLEGGVPHTDIKAAEEQRRAGQGTYDPEAQLVRGLAKLIQLDREIRVAKAVFAAGNYDAARRITLAGTSQVSDYANSDPLGVVNAGFDSCLIARPNKMVFGQAAWSKFRAHPRVVKSVKGGLSGDGMVSREQVAELFEVQEVIVGAAMVDYSREGQAENLVRVWGKHIALLYIDPEAGPGSDAPTFGFTAACGGMVSLSKEDSDVGLMGGIKHRVGERVKELICAPSTSYFIENAVA